MNDYCIGIAYATGCVINDDNEKYLVVRNLNKWYVENIAKATGYKAYESTYNFERDKQNQWIVKARNIKELPKLSDVRKINDFCRAYIELHGTIDMSTAKRRDGCKFKKPRLRIYGSEDIISFINTSLPVSEKKIQYITNKVDDNYIGKTCAIYYQSKKEIEDILNWIDGDLKNLELWEKWKRQLNIID